MELLSECKRGIKVLDVGCGNGFLSSCLAKNGFDVVGIDISEDGIKIAQGKYPEIKFHVASAYGDLSNIVDCVDVVIAADVIEHLFSPKRLVDNVYSVLRPGGILIVSTPYHGYLKNIALSVFNKWDDHHTANWEGGHIKFFSEKTLEVLLDDVGFTDISFHNVGRLRWLWKSMVCRSFKPDR